MLLLLLLFLFLLFPFSGLCTLRVKSVLEEERRRQ